MIDVNVYVSRWPCRRLPDDETPRLVRRLRDRGITSAWTGSFDGLLHRDVAAVNSRLAQECRRFGDGAAARARCDALISNVNSVLCINAEAIQVSTFEDSGLQDAPIIRQTHVEDAIVGV